ncbi:hypothetical protein R6Q59_016490 [Mikania micrantha]
MENECGWLTAFFDLITSIAISRRGRHLPSQSPSIVVQTSQSSSIVIQNRHRSWFRIAIDLGLNRWSLSSSKPATIVNGGGIGRRRRWKKGVGEATGRGDSATDSESVFPAVRVPPPTTTKARVLRSILDFWANVMFWSGRSCGVWILEEGQTCKDNSNCDLGLNWVLSLFSDLSPLYDHTGARLAGNVARDNKKNMRLGMIDELGKLLAR